MNTSEAKVFENLKKLETKYRNMRMERSAIQKKIY